MKNVDERGCREGGGDKGTGPLWAYQTAQECSGKKWVGLSGTRWSVWLGLDDGCDKDSFLTDFNKYNTLWRHKQATACCRNYGYTPKWQNTHAHTSESLIELNLFYVHSWQCLYNANGWVCVSVSESLPLKNLWEVATANHNLKPESMWCSLPKHLTCERSVNSTVNYMYNKCVHVHVFAGICYYF